MSAFKFNYSKWRHGGWYVNNICYPSGAVGCVSNNYTDGRWRIVCDTRSPAPSFATRHDAALDELALAESTNKTESKQL